VIQTRRKGYYVVSDLNFVNGCRVVVRSAVKTKVTCFLPFMHHMFGVDRVVGEEIEEGNVPLAAVLSAFRLFKVLVIVFDVPEKSAVQMLEQMTDEIAFTCCEFTVCGSIFAGLEATTRMAFDLVLVQDGSRQLGSVGLLMELRNAGAIMPVVLLLNSNPAASVRISTSVVRRKTSVAEVHRSNAEALGFFSVMALPIDSAELVSTIHSVHQSMFMDAVASIQLPELVNNSSTSLCQRETTRRLERPHETNEAVESAVSDAYLLSMDAAVLAALRGGTCATGSGAATTHCNVPHKKIPGKAVEEIGAESALSSGSNGPGKRSAGLGWAKPSIESARIISRPTASSSDEKSKPLPARRNRPPRKARSTHLVLDAVVGTSRTLDEDIPDHVVAAMREHLLSLGDDLNCVFPPEDVADRNSSVDLACTDVPDDDPESSQSSVPHHSETEYSSLCDLDESLLTSSSLVGWREIHSSGSVVVNNMSSALDRKSNLPTLLDYVNSDSGGYETTRSKKVSFLRGGDTVLPDTSDSTSEGSVSSSPMRLQPVRYHQQPQVQDFLREHCFSLDSLAMVSSVSEGSIELAAPQPKRHKRISSASEFE
jgi:hypothetical protein